MKKDKKAKEERKKNRGVKKVDRNLFLAKDFHDAIKADNESKNRMERFKMLLGNRKEIKTV